MSSQFTVLLTIVALAGQVEGQSSDQKVKVTAAKPLPKQPPRRASTRDPLPIAADIDRIIDQRLSEGKLHASPTAEDAEFLRRATVDIIGRIPTYEETLALLASDSPRKRQVLIDDLIERSSYGDHFATIWHELIVPRSTGKPKTGKDPFAIWLAEQFNRNHGWDAIVRDMLEVEGKIRDFPQSGFIMANSENLEPRANLVTDATARLFWGVQLRCAECHDHPFASWKQSDFWGTAAFFSRLRKGYTDGKNPAGWTLTERRPDETESRNVAESLAVPGVPGPAIIVPAAAGAKSGLVVKASFLGGHEVEWSDDGPFRPRFSAWATGRGNPYFATNAVNRMWSHFFGRGFVNPLDEFHQDNPPSHPELLELLAAEFADSDYDLAHLIRCICNSQAYQRTSRPAFGNEKDTALFSHMAIRVMRPEVLYDSLSVVLYPPVAKVGQQGPLVVDRVNPLPNVSRDEFIRFFGSPVDENHGSVVNQGVPQYLRLMNGALLDGELPGVARFSGRNSPTEIVENLYLAAYSRYPTADELRRVTEHFADSPSATNAPAGVLWVLLNSSEFVLNH